MKVKSQFFNKTGTFACNNRVFQVLSSRILKEISEIKKSLSVWLEEGGGRSLTY